MKIKCPACSTTLEIPAAAAGKVVKCPCGQQLKAPAAPAGTPTQATAPTKPAPTKPAPAKPAPVTPAPAKQAPAKPAPAKPAPAKKPAGPVPQPVAAGADLFDQLTEDDYQPIKSVSQPGKKPPAPTVGENTRKLLDQARGNEGKKKRKKKKTRSTKNGDRRSLPGAIACFVLAFATTGFGCYLAYKRLEESTFADEVVYIIGMALVPVLFLVFGVLMMGRKKD